MSDGLDAWRCELEPKAAALLFERPSVAPALARVRRIFERAPRADSRAYSIVTEPRALGREETIRTALAWLNNAAVLVDAFAIPIEPEERAFLARPRVDLGIRPPPDPRAAHPLATSIYEAVTALGAAMTFEDDEVHTLVEPLYLLACSYELAYWVLSPLSPETTEEPLAPAFALWEAGVVLDFEGSGAELCVRVGRR